MSDAAGIARGRRWPRRPASRTAAVPIALACLTLLSAACGRPSSAGGSGGASIVAASTNAQLVAFSACMRSHAVAKYPDPTASGALSKESARQLGVSRAQLQAAQAACQRLLPNGGNGPTPAQVQQATQQALRFSQCMRAHGVKSFPDPATTGRHRIPDPATLGIDQGSPQYQAANSACGRYRPPYMPSNGAYNSWASANGVS